MNPEEPVQAPVIKSANLPSETVREQDKIHLVLAYLGIFALIPLLTVKDSEYVKWHAKNGLALGVGGGLAWTLFAATIGQVPFLGWFFSCVGCAGLVVVDILAMAKALGGVRYRVPLATDLAERL